MKLELDYNDCRVLILRGVSGCGKSTFAKKVVELDPKKWVIVSRDELREKLLGKERLQKYFDQGLNFSIEQEITKMEHVAIAKALIAGHNVISDNTNLKNKHVLELCKVVLDCGIPLNLIRFQVFPIIDRDTAMKRIQQRGERFVKEDVIQKQIDTFRNLTYPDVSTLKDYQPKKLHYPPFDVEPLEQDDSLPKAIICDLDGTLAHRALLDHPYIHYRSFFEYEKCHTDDPDPLVAEIINAMADKGYRVLFVSGRKSECRTQCHDFIKKATGISPSEYELFMRDEKIDIVNHGNRVDDASDDVVKYRLVNKYIRGHYNVIGVLDDRKRVVALWEALGLRVLNVGLLNDDF